MSRVLATCGKLARICTGTSYIERSLSPEEPRPVSLDDETVHIHVVAFNEEHFIEDTLESLIEQPVCREHENVSIVLVDSYSTDRTRQIAREYVDDVVLVDRGKLTARDQAIRQSKDATIIVNTDADTIYPTHWLSHVLAPFSDPEIVGVAGPKLSRDPLYKPLRAWWSLVVERRSRHYPAPNSAFRRNAYLESGGFDLSIDEFDRNGELNREEEYAFRDRLNEIGTIEWTDAGVFTSERQQPISLTDSEAVAKFKRERKAGLRF